MRIIIIPFLLFACLLLNTPLNSQSLNSGLFNSGTLNIDSGAVINIADTFLNKATGILINKGTINAGGAVANQGMINGKGKIVLSGTLMQNISGTGGIISNLEINNAGATIMPSNMQTVTGSLILSAGMLTTNSALTLKSTDSSTARVAQVTSGSIAGNVIVERYLPARRAWRLISAPLGNTNTIYQSWQNSQQPSPGVGTFITGPGGANGLDDAANYSLPTSDYSLKTYDEASQHFLPVTNTFSASLSDSSGSAANNGYFIFIAGDRSYQNLISPNTNSTTLAAKGTLQTGAQTFAASGTANNFTLVGNPYASPVDFDQLNRASVAKRFYVWDPSLSSVGAYVLADDYDNDGIYDIIPTSMQTKILQSGQAFFIQTMSSGPASVTFNENNKSEFTDNTGFKPTNGTNEVLRINLYLRNIDTSSILADGVLSEYNSDYSAAVDIEDGAKMENINENLAIVRDGRLLAFERRPFATANDTLFLNLTNTTVRTYGFQFEPFNLLSVVSASLEDSYLSTSSPLSVIAPTVIDFNITADPASSAAGRFKIVLKTGVVLPITLSSVKAYQQGNDIAVEWRVQNETTIKYYEVEKSTDAITFRKVAAQIATGSNQSTVNYSWLDVSSTTGNNYYRIRSIGINGEIKYSQVIKVTIGKGKAGYYLYPNPVAGNTINLQFINQPKGLYNLNLINQLGQVMLTKQISRGNGSSTETMELIRSIKKGHYVLEIKAPDKSKCLLKVVY